jgi:hypothetical protein
VFVPKGYDITNALPIQGVDMNCRKQRESFSRQASGLYGFRFREMTSRLQAVEPITMRVLELGSSHSKLCFMLVSLQPCAGLVCYIKDGQPLACSDFEALHLVSYRRPRTCSDLFSPGQGKNMASVFASSEHCAPLDGEFCLVMIVWMELSVFLYRSLAKEVCASVS